jgi:DNA-binding response OmpR family regulator
VLNRGRVLVVDEISDTADVLQAVLEPRGVIVNRVRRWCESDAVSEDRPAVVVLDAESLPAGVGPTQGAWHNVPQVIIGTIRPPAAPLTPGTGSEVERRYLKKPFQFVELIQAVEALIPRRL